jgi:hypothetical protein
MVLAVNVSPCGGAPTLFLFHLHCSLIFQAQSEISPKLFEKKNHLLLIENYCISDTISSFIQPQKIIILSHHILYMKTWTMNFKGLLKATELVEAESGYELSLLNSRTGVFTPIPMSPKEWKSAGCNGTHL